MRFAFAALLLAAMPVTATADTLTMQAAAAGFYDVYRTFHPSDGIPAAGDLAKYEPFLSPALDGLLKQGAAAEERFTKANKNSPPLVEGDLFTSMFEGATSVSVGSCSGGAKAAQCTVALEYADPKSPAKWIDKIYLVNTPGGWRVDDIAYGAPWAFGNKGRLTDTLRQVIGFQ
jgi:hypothetical protein